MQNSMWYTLKNQGLKIDHSTTLRTTWFLDTPKEFKYISKLFAVLSRRKIRQKINRDAISKQEAPQLLRHLFLEMRQTTK